MSDGMHASDQASGPGTAGGAVGSPLKQARLAQGLTIEGLASMTKVAPAKLAALEAGRYQELPDAAFARALAMTVCRVLKIDAAPVLAGLPAAQPISLLPKDERAVPFDASRTKLRLNMDLSPSRVKWPAMMSLQWLAPLVVLVAALGIYLWPEEVQWPAWWPSSGTQAIQADEVPEPVSESGLPASLGHAVPVTEPASAVLSAPDTGQLPSAAAAAGHSVAQPLMLDSRLPEVSIQAAASPEAAPAVVPVSSAASPLVMTVSESSWIEVRDGAGKRLLSRHVQSGETVGLSGTPPYAVRIGNAGGVNITYRGDEVELAAFTRNNVAKLELK